MPCAISGRPHPLPQGWVKEHMCGKQGSPFGPKNHPSCWCGPTNNNNNDPQKPTFKDSESWTPANGHATAECCAVSVCLQHTQHHS